jgi:diadenosine tetraphosphate (Ap4A) HIT family hydrolase
VTGFVRHSQLAAEAALVCDWPLSRVLLMNDMRFPWLILVPRRKDIAEFFDLEAADRNLLSGEIARAGVILKHWATSRTGCDKLNIGMIGNIVRQLHVHIVVRRTTDACWPFPVWGRGDPERYPTRAVERAVAELASMCASQ